LATASLCYPSFAFAERYTHLTQSKTPSLARPNTLPSSQIDPFLWQPRARAALPNLTILRRLLGATKRLFSLDTLPSNPTPSSSPVAMTLSELPPPPVPKHAKLGGYDFYRSIGSPKWVIAPMVDQSELVSAIYLPARRRPQTANRKPLEV
jgi:hypothetical protein